MRFMPNVRAQPPHMPKRDRRAMNLAKRGAEKRPESVANSGP